MRPTIRRYGFAMLTVLLLLAGLVLIAPQGGADENGCDPLFPDPAENCADAEAYPGWFQLPPTPTPYPTATPTPTPQPRYQPPLCTHDQLVEAMEERNTRKALGPDGNDVEVGVINEELDDDDFETLAYEIDIRRGNLNCETLAEAACIPEAGAITEALDIRYREVKPPVVPLRILEDGTSEPTDEAICARYECTVRAGMLVVHMDDVDSATTALENMGVTVSSVDQLLRASRTDEYRLVQFVPRGLDPVDLGRRLRAQGIPADPIYVVGTSQSWGYSPSDAPSARRGPNTVSLGGIEGNGATVYVLDTGLVADVLTSGRVTSFDEDLPSDADDNDWQDWVYGHGTFVGGIINQLAPEATLRFVRPKHNGSTGEFHGTTQHGTKEVVVFDELDLIQTIDSLATEITNAGADWVVVNISLGFYACDEPSPADRDAMERLVAAIGNNGFVVMAAGNEGLGRWEYRNREPDQSVAGAPNDQATESAEAPESSLEGQAFFPAGWAATDRRLISVGAVQDFNEDSEQAEPAQYSNVGSWVEVFAEGNEVVAILPFDDLLKGHVGYEGPDKDGEILRQGFAAWSGTSFAAPCVTALLVRNPIEGGADGDDPIGLLEDETQMVPVTLDDQDKFVDMERLAIDCWGEPEQIVR